MTTVIDLRTVTLQQTFSWTCDGCGRVNYDRGVVLPPESIECAELPGSIDPETTRAWVEVGGDGSVVLAPSSVTCSLCGAEYRTDPSAG